jgi:hypothetical protein
MVPKGIARLVTVSVFAIALTAKAEQTCIPLSIAAYQAAPTVKVQWENTFLCAGAPDSDTYRIVVRVWHASGTESAAFQQMVLTHKTPRARGRIPGGMKTGDTLPVNVSPSVMEQTFTVTGTYVLAETDEGKKANHHYILSGVAGAAGAPFSVPVNIKFRATGVEEE